MWWRSANCSGWCRVVVSLAWMSEFRNKTWLNFKMCVGRRPKSTRNPIFEWQIGQPKACIQASKDTRSLSMSWALSQYLQTESHSWHDRFNLRGEWLFGTWNSLSVWKCCQESLAIFVSLQERNKKEAESRQTERERGRGWQDTLMHMPSPFRFAPSSI